MHTRRLPTIMGAERDPTLTEARIRELARTQSYDRGENYYDQGAVGEVVLRGETIRADVEGSQFRPYTVTIEFDDSGIARTDCSCPYDHGGICKHRVAVLLTYVRDPEAIDRRPPISELVANADPETLRELVVTLADRRPELASWVESHLDMVQGEATVADARDRTPDINRESIRRQVQSILRSNTGRRAPAHDPYAAVEADVDELRDLLEQAREAVVAVDGETALDILEPLADELMDEKWLALSYDDSHAIFAFLDDLDRDLAEALLAADLSEDDRKSWEARLWTWEQEMGGYTPQPPYSVALDAARRGWDSEPIQRAMDGDHRSVDLWDGDPAWHAEASIRARLNVLERQGRVEEYLNLAAAADLLDASVTMLVEEGRIEEAIEYGKQGFRSPGDALMLAQTLRDHDRPQAALEVAQHGVTLDGTGKSELARWLRDRATGLDEPDVAVEAAVAAFEASPTLAAYQATEELADEKWPAIREELLASLAETDTTPWNAPEHVEILLYAEQHEEAIAIADRYSDSTVVAPVVEEVCEEHPHWTIDACKEQAEPIIDEGQSKEYRRAVQWLETAGKAARAAGELDEWRGYVEDLRDEHHRKYKLRPMLEELLEESTD